jgi:hypothetical protein
MLLLKRDSNDYLQHRQTCLLSLCVCVENRTLESVILVQHRDTENVETQRDQTLTTVYRLTQQFHQLFARHCDLVITI